MFSDRLLSSAYQFAKPHWSLAVNAVFLAAILSFLEVISTALVLPLTQVLGSSQFATNLQTTSFLALLPNFFGHIPEKWRLLSILLSLLCLTIVKNIFAYHSSISIYDFMLRSGTLIRQKCVERFLELGIPFYTRTSLGELLSYVNEQSQRSELLFARYLEIFRNVLVVGALLCFLITLSPILTIITIASLAIVIKSLRTVIKNLQIHSRKAADAIERFSLLIAEIISGIRVVKSYGAEFRELENARQSLNDRYRADLTGYKFYSASGPITETVGISVLLAIILAGTLLFSSSDAALPILLTYTVTLMRILPRVNQLNSLRSEISLMQGSFEAIQAFLISTANTGLQDGQKIYQGLNSGLIFENLTFTFPSNPEPTLRQISFQMARGKTTAIVGSSGSGKSTLVDLIMRFYDPDSGSIQVDKVDLKELQIRSWRRSIAMVSQDTFLFNCSVHENIAYGRPDATDAEILEAAKRAYADRFIQDLPQGFETIVGNRGTRLSGGQRQRISIARAILCDPDILILDEATSALDSASERIVQQAIEEVSRDRTVLVIAHRLSTIEKADNIVVLQNGSLIEQGTHLTLLGKQGVYSALYQAQAFSDSSLTPSEN